MASIYKKWGKEEEEFIKQNYLNMTDQELAKCLNRSLSSVKGKRHHLGLTKTPIFAIYKGDNYIMSGTRKEIAKTLNILEDTVTYYRSKCHQSKCVGGNCMKVIKLGYE